LPAAGAAVQRLRLAYASCQRWEDGYFSAYRQMLADEPDMVLFVGDYIYEGDCFMPESAIRPHKLPRVKTIADYRTRYELYKSDVDLQAMHAAAPWLLTWDDHEVENNYAGTLSIRERRPLSNQRNDAYQAYYEHMPLRAASMVGGLKTLKSTGGLRLYGSYDFGKLARIYMLDNRQYRSKPICGERGRSAVCETRDSQARTMLGVEQERWLANSMASAAQDGFPWNLIVQQTRVSTGSYKKGPGAGAANDSWDGFPAARQRLIDDIAASKASNPIIVDVRSRVVAAEFVGTSISSTPADSKEKRDERQQLANPHCLLSDSVHRGYGLLDITPKGLQATLKKVDNIKRPKSKISTLANFVVSPGDPAVRPA
jgi:alkaline phosphatase D